MGINKYIHCNDFDNDFEHKFEWSLSANKKYIPDSDSSRMLAIYGYNKHPTYIYQRYWQKWQKKYSGGILLSSADWLTDRHQTYHDYITIWADQ